MTTLSTENLISSKEVLRITGISRATLNNYIKMGILPRPLVRRPKSGLSGVKQIGYFPVDVLDRLETVKRLKREGHSMEDIRRYFQGVDFPEDGKEVGPAEDYTAGDVTAHGIPSALISHRGIRLTLPNISLPSYLVNYDFEISWINEEAEIKLFRQAVRRLEEGPLRNVFKLFFNWEFQKLTLNWKDVVTFHMAFAKTKFAKTWIEKLYWDISETEIAVLQETYDRVTRLPQEGLQASQVNLLRKDGATESYRVYTIFFVEGILFIYNPAEVYYHWEKAP